jgi:hypothetical protein
MTMATDWTEIGQDGMAGVPGLVLLVDADDGTAAVYRGIALGETVEDALADYAAGYNCDPGDEVKVDWHLYRDGEEVYSGRHAFEVR